MISHIGIDFGACNIKAGKVSQTGKPLKIKLNKNQAGGNFIPNVISYEMVKDALEVKVGVKNRDITAAENTINQIKPKLSQKNWTKFIPNLGREVDAATVVKDIFSWLWREITVKFSKNETLDAAITVPVSFSEVQKNLMRQAALDAQIPVTAVITEPFAALFSLEEILEEDGEQVVLIFDFGGSTLDLSLFRIERDDDDLSVTELAAAGLKFGGLDIDALIFENVLRVNYAEDVRKILDSDNTGKFKMEILDCISKIKEEIFANEEDEAVDSIVDKNGTLYEFKITRDEITGVLENSGVRKKIIALLDEMIDDAEIDKGEITAVKPFGGTSAIDYFRQLLTDYFGAEIFDCEDFDAGEIYMGVALGAAKYLLLADESVEIRNVVPYSIGLANGGEFVRQIKRNELSGFVTPYKSILISELEKNNWRVAVYQSFSNEFELPLENEDVIFIGDVELDAKLYTAPDAILFKMQTDGAGKIYMRFFEQRAELDEPALIEEKIVRTGG